MRQHLGEPLAPLTLPAPLAHLLIFVICYFTIRLTRGKHHKQRRVVICDRLMWPVETERADEERRHERRRATGTMKVISSSQSSAGKRFHVSITIPGNLMRCERKFQLITSPPIQSYAIFCVIDMVLRPKSATISIPSIESESKQT